MRKKNYKNQKGITLIALVVTIVVLLILAGITITMLFSENGIIKKAQEAKNATERDQVDTQAGLSNLLDQMNNELGIDASAITLAKDKSKYYGKTVSNYTVGNSALQTALNTEGITWQIFYAGKDFSTDNKNHIYLIASDYVPYANLPQTSGSHNLAKGDTDYKAYWNNDTLGDYYNSTTSTVTMNSLYQTLNKSHYDYLVANNSGSYPNNENMKAVTYMLDKDAWAGFAGGKAEYAIGGPTVEMLMKSYSEKYANDETIQGIKEGAYKYQAKAEKDVTTNPSNGYQISKDYGNNWANSYSSIIARKNETDTLYINDNTSNIALGYWIASPSAFRTTRVACVDFYGNVTNTDYNNGACAFRPLVSLKSDIRRDCKKFCVN